MGKALDLKFLAANRRQRQTQHEIHPKTSLTVTPAVIASKSLYCSIFGASSHA